MVLLSQVALQYFPFEVFAVGTVACMQILFDRYQRVALHTSHDTEVQFKEWRRRHSCSPDKVPNLQAWARRSPSPTRLRGWCSKRRTRRWAFRYPSCALRALTRI